MFSGAPDTTEHAHNYKQALSAQYTLQFVNTPQPEHRATITSKATRSLMKLSNLLHAPMTTNTLRGVGRFMSRSYYSHQDEKWGDNLYGPRKVQIKLS